LTVVLPIDLSVSQASSNATSNTTSVDGSNEALWKPRIIPPSTFTDDFARLANARRKLGRVCGLRWTITRPSDHTFLGLWILIWIKAREGNSSDGIMSRVVRKQGAAVLRMARITKATNFGGLLLSSSRAYSLQLNTRYRLSSP
jgi:hypothetical protein